MKPKKHTQRLILPHMVDRFKDGTLNSRLAVFTATVAKPGDLLPLVTIDSETFVKGCHQIPLGKGLPFIGHSIRWKPSTDQANV